VLWGFNRLKKISLPVTVALLVVILDLITKKLIETFVQPYEIIHVLPFLRIVNIKNTGAAFGLFSDLNNNFFIIISIAAIIFIIFYMIRTPSRLERLSLSLVLGGATGNLIDRLTLGKVIDFIDIFVNDWHWPAFNVADSALTVGIILFLIVNIKTWGKHNNS
jgi:signal peptidase II